MFQTPLTDLLSGDYNYPNTVNAVDANGNPVSQPFWAGEPGDQLNPLVPFTAVADNLMQDPSQNPVQFPDLGGVLSDGWMLGQDYLNDYNPFVTGSFLYWGAPTLYSVPALLAGLVQNFTGIPNQFVGIPGWYGAGGDPTGGTAGPAYLLTGVPAGFGYLAQGLLGYVNPGTYIGPNGISLSNTLLRTYAWGSLPGADVLRRLIGLEPNPAPVSVANSQSGTGTTGSTASGIGSLLGGSLGSLPALGGFAGSPTQKIAESKVTSTDGVEAANETPQEPLVTPNVSEQLDLQPGNSGAPAPNNVSVPVQSNFQQSIKKAVDNITNAGPKLNLEKLNPLDLGNANDGGTTGNHELGAGKTPVRDLIKKVTGGLTGQNDASASTESTGSTGGNTGTSD